MCFFYYVFMSFVIFVWFLLFILFYYIYYIHTSIFPSFYLLFFMFQWLYMHSWLGQCLDQLVETGLQTRWDEGWMKVCHFRFRLSFRKVLCFTQGNTVLNQFHTVMNWVVYITKREREKRGPWCWTNLFILAVPVTFYWYECWFLWFSSVEFWHDKIK